MFDHNIKELRRQNLQKTQVLTSFIIKLIKSKLLKCDLSPNNFNFLPFLGHLQNNL